MVFEFTDDNSVQVDLGERGYPIVFEALGTLGKTLAACMQPGKCILISNDVVGPLHADKAMESLRVAGWQPDYVQIKDGEANKSVEQYVDLANRVLSLEVSRKTPLIALGGGTTTDLVGFVAATVNRGVPFANVPTSLLAMVDASVGGKTAVNMPQGKNLLGAFWQPFLVHVSVETLETLSDEELNCGMGEVVKHGVIDEVEVSKGVFTPSTAFFEWLEQNASALRDRDPVALTYAIKRSCEIKAAVVKQDELESLGKREILNLGHTVGHAIEHVLGYGVIRHGEAVGIGTMAETQLSVLRKKCKDDKLPHRIGNLLKWLNLPTGYPGLDSEALSKAILSDKKRKGDKISITLPVCIGVIDMEKLSPEEIRPAFQFIEKNANI